MEGYLKLRLQKPKVKYVLIGFGLRRAKKHLVFARGYTDESCIFRWDVLIEILFAQKQRISKLGVEFSQEQDQNKGQCSLV